MELAIIGLIEHKKGKTICICQKIRPSRTTAVNCAHNRRHVEDPRTARIEIHTTDMQALSTPLTDKPNHHAPSATPSAGHDVGNASALTSGTQASRSRVLQTSGPDTEIVAQPHTASVSICGPCASRMTLRRSNEWPCSLMKMRLSSGRPRSDSSASTSATAK